MWRLLPAVTAALLVITVASFSLYAVESGRGAAARSFGFQGQSWRVIVVTGDVGDDVRLSAALREFCDEYGASVAFSSADSGVVTLYDPLGRFRDRDGGIYQRLSDEPSQPAALLSTAIGGASGERSSVVPDGVELLGRFNPTVQFDGRYPALLANLAAAPVHSGVFRFAGMDAGEEAALAGFFARQDAAVIRLDVEDPVSFIELWSTLFGKVVMLFVVISFLAAFLVTQGYASLSQPRLLVASFCGATSRDLGFLLLSRLFPLVAAGTLVGTGATLVMILLLRRAMLADVAAIGMALSTTLLVCIAALALTTASISGWQGRAINRALPR